MKATYARTAGRNLAATVLLLVPTVTEDSLSVDRRG
jgi:hypothetical protein